MDWAPDGQSVAYSYGDGIWIVQPPVYETTLLARIPGSQMGDIMWSPEGQYLAFSSERSTDELIEQTLWTVKADGTELRRIAPDSPFFHPHRPQMISAWLNHRVLAVECWRIGLVQVDTERDVVTVLTDGGSSGVWHIQAVGGPYHWSPGRKHLVIDHGGHLVLVDVQQAEEYWLSSLEEWPGESFRGWSQDGQRFLYSKRNAEEQYDLWLWYVAQERGDRLLSGANQGALSPDGARIVFLRQEDHPGQVPTKIAEDIGLEQWPPALTAGMLEIDTGATILYGPAGYRADEGPIFWEGGQPVWSPDGEPIVYWGEDGDIRVASADGAWQQRLTWGMEIIQVLWSPDGNKLALRTTDQAWIVERPGRE